jgi:hypothetical protein
MQVIIRALIELSKQRVRKCAPYTVKLFFFEEDRDTTDIARGLMTDTRSEIASVGG